MFNKKALGFEWYILIISFIVSMGILFFQSQTYESLPRIGEYSIEISKSLDRGGVLPSIIGRLLSDVNKNTNESFDDNRIFKLNSYCEDADYAQSLVSKNFVPPEWLSKRNSVNCMVEESELMKYYEEAFEEQYNEFKSEDFSEIGLNFLSIAYTSSVEKKTDTYLNIVKTDDKFDLPLQVNEEEVGSFYLNPAFKIPFNYPFDDPEKEVCIFSRDCGGTCDQVIAKYPDIEFRKKEFSCNDYFFCTDAPRDDFGNSYTCDSPYFCMWNSLQDTQNVIPLPYTSRPSCNDICENKGSVCLIGIDDGKDIRKCDEDFGFEDDDPRDDYCICGESPEKVIPLPYDENPSCTDICGTKNKGCVRGVDDNSPDQTCSDRFGFEENDDYCVCGGDSQTTTPVCPDCYCLDDWRFERDCNPYGEEQTSTQIRTCKKEDLCDDSLKTREVSRCCGFSYESCGCSAPVNDGDENCCVQLDYCQCEGASQCGVCGNPDCPPPEEPDDEEIILQNGNEGGTGDESETGGEESSP